MDHNSTIVLLFEPFHNTAPVLVVVVHAMTPRTAGVALELISVPQG